MIVWLIIFAVGTLVLGVLLLRERRASAKVFERQRAAVNSNIQLFQELHDAKTENYLLLRRGDDAVRLAAAFERCVRRFVKDMDTYSMKLGDEPVALTAERDALKQWDDFLTPARPAPPPETNSNADSQTEPATPDPTP